MKQSNPRRQVSFNIEEELYNEFKKRMLDDHTTPTAYLTRCIRERVERETVQFQVDSRLYRQFTELAGPGMPSRRNCCWTISAGRWKRPGRRRRGGADLSPVRQGPPMV